nr:hypothetical protein Q903MT_gene3602 [Picea sitchensis]
MPGYHLPLLDLYFAFTFAVTSSNPPGKGRLRTSLHREKYHSLINVWIRSVGQNLQVRSVGSPNPMCC